MREIELRNVDYLYEATDRHVPALRDVSLAVGPRSSSASSGQSGCGKTTLLNIVAGFLAPRAARS